MTRLSLAILGTAAILTSALAGPALAKGTTARDANEKQMTAHKMTAHKTHRHMQRHAAYRSERFRSGNALATGDQYDRPVGPVGAAGAIVGGAAEAAGEIATAPFRAFDNNYDNYYGYGYGGRDWKNYASRNNLACTPGTMFRDADGRLHPCQ